MTRFDGVPVPAGASVVDDPRALAALFSDRPAVHLYALGDLDEPFWSASRWYRRGDAVVGAVGLPDDEGTAAYAMSTRDPDGTLTLLAELAPALPSGLLVVGEVGAAEALRAVRPLVWDGPHQRYELVAPASVPAPDDRVVPLGPAAVDELRSLYASEPGAAFFRSHMLVADSFVGIRVGGRLVAASGTHVVSERHGVAAIGAVFTHPDHRGRGLGRAVTAGTIHRIVDRVAVIGLNVASGNTAARRIYESIGFTPIHDYEEAELA